MQLLDQPQARAEVFEHIQRIEADPSFGLPTAAMWEAHDESLDMMMTVSHQTNRGKKELAGVLGLSQNRFGELFAGKSVLDVGCGVGVLDGQLADNRRTRVTALDHNPDNLAQVPQRSNIRTVLGSGYDLQAVLGDEQFDIVLLGYSSLTWARTDEQAKQSIVSSLRATRIGGTALFIPFIQHLKSHEAYKAAITKGSVPGYKDYEIAPEGLEFTRNSWRAEDWMRHTKIRTLDAAEKAGAITCTYMASPKNKQQLPMNKLGPLHPFEEYSVSATVQAH